MTTDPKSAMIPEPFEQPTSINAALNALVTPLLSQAYDKGYQAATAHAESELEKLREKIRILKDGLERTMLFSNSKYSRERARKTLSAADEIGKPKDLKEVRKFVAFFNGNLDGLDAAIAELE